MAYSLPIDEHGNPLFTPEYPGEVAQVSGFSGGYRGLSHNSAIITGTGAIVTAIGQKGGGLFWSVTGATNNTGESAVFDIMMSPNPGGAIGWSALAAISGAPNGSGYISLTGLYAGYWATRLRTIYSGAGLTGMLHTFFEFA